jgi:GAF domain-containing protein
VKITYAGTAIERALNEQVPIFVPDAQRELTQYPGIASVIRQANVHSGYVFPVSTSRTRLGVLTFGRKETDEFSPADVELMRSVPGHVAVALESVLAIRSVETHQRNLARERDRLRLLLEMLRAVAVFLWLCVTGTSNLPPTFIHIFR